MPFSQFINRGLLAYLFTNATGALGTLPTSLFMGLSSSTPTKTGTNITAPTSGDYARIGITRVGATFSAPTDADPSVVDNANLIQFALSTEAWDASATWTHLTVHSLVSGGDFWGFSALTPTQSITAANQRIEIPIGDLDFTQT